MERSRCHPYAAWLGGIWEINFCLQGRLQVDAHLVGDVRVRASYALYLMSQADLGQDLGDPVLDHPCLVTMTKAVWCQAVLDR